MKGIDRHASTECGRDCDTRSNEDSTEKVDFFSHAPPEIALCIFSFATLRDLAVLASVSRCIHGLAKAPPLWRPLLQRDFSVWNAVVRPTNDPKRDYQNHVRRQSAFIHDDGSSEPPSIEGIWNRPVFARTDSPDWLSKYVTEIRDRLSNRLTRGPTSSSGVGCVTFSVSGDPRLDWFVTRGRLCEIDFLRQLLCAFRAIMKNGLVVPSSIAWSKCESGGFSAQLSCLLQVPFGACTIEETAAFVRDCPRADHPNDQQTYLTSDRWGWLFHNPSKHARTLVGIDLPTRRAWVVCLTYDD